MKKILAVTIASILLLSLVVLGCPQELPRDGEDCGSDKFTFTTDCQTAYEMWNGEMWDVVQKYQNCAADSDCETISAGISCEEGLNNYSCPMVISKLNRENYESDIERVRQEVCACNKAMCHVSICEMIYATCESGKCKRNVCTQGTCYDAGIPEDAASPDVQ